MPVKKPKLTPEEIKALSDEILALKEEKNAVLLAHYYQIMPIQRLADRVGDSLGLAKAAKEIKKADLIVFAGVYFMAETAKLLNPETTVLIPNVKAGCPLADQCNPQLIDAAREKYPNAPVVVYVNTTAETKAHADLTCTSSNAAKIVERLNVPEVIFGPDRNLGYYVQKQLPEVKLHFVPPKGHCYVHKRFDLETILALKKEHPGAVLIAHPECNPDIQEHADFVGSTAKMLRFAEEATEKEIIVATEKGLVDRLSELYPDKQFYLAKNTAICRNMKRITLENLRDALLYEQYEVTIPEAVQINAKKAILRMLELS
ncbi:MAG: quinolinate synthase NadA [Candidatus Heimdallarchaeota archaeon]|nr:quinolinate synthase NadA [Candidatus Heimdallarchaeota archaeon]